MDAGLIFGLICSFSLVAVMPLWIYGIVQHGKAVR